MPDGSLSTLIIRNVVVGGRRTSVRLEPAMWEALYEIARRRRLSIHALVTQIERKRNASTLTAAIRVYIVDFYRSAAAQAAAPTLPEQAPAPKPLSLSL